MIQRVVCVPAVRGQYHLVIVTGYILDFFRHIEGVIIVNIGPVKLESRQLDDLGVDVDQRIVVHIHLVELDVLVLLLVRESLELSVHAVQLELRRLHLAIFDAHASHRGGRGAVHLDCGPVDRVDARRHPAGIEVDDASLLDGVLVVKLAILALSTRFQPL